jgi:hypothetical protein
MKGRERDYLEGSKGRKKKSRSLGLNGIEKGVSSQSVSQPASVIALFVE